jgi:glutamine synthetase
MGFDGSSIRGWQAINESDMLMVPDPETAFIDPFFDHPTLVLICNIEDPITRQPYSRDPRWIARKAETYLKSTGFGDTALLRSRGGVLHLQRCALQLGPDHGFYSIDSDEGAWNTAATRAAATWPTSPATRRATSRSRRSTASRTCAARWC